MANERRTIFGHAVCARALSLALGGVLLAVACGCTSTSTVTYQRPIPPKPKKAQPAPPDAKADAVVLTLGAAPRDTNGNGYPDLIHATTHLFDRRYAPPLYEPGVFVFELFPPGESSNAHVQPLHQWFFDDEASRQALARSGFGVCYRFRLSLLDDGGTDQLDVPMADIVCHFESTIDESDLVTSEVNTIQIGRRVLVPQLIWEEEGEAAPSPTRLDAWP